MSSSQYARHPETMRHPLEDEESYDPTGPEAASRAAILLTDSRAAEDNEDAGCGARTMCAAPGFKGVLTGEGDGSESGSDENQEATMLRPQRKNKLQFASKGMYLAFIGVVCIVSAPILISQTSGSTIQNGPHHGVFDAPEFEQMLWEQIQPVLGASVPQLELSGHINTTIRHLKSVAASELPKDQSAALQDARLTAQNWIDLKEMTRGGRDPAVQEAGKITLRVLRENLFSSQEVIAKRLKEALKHDAYDLMKLRAAIVPGRLDIALGAWAAQHNESHGAWKGLLDDQTALQSLRDQANNRQLVTPDLDVKGRRLQDVFRRLALGVGGVPVGILSVVLLAIGEILVHLEIFIPAFHLPTWAWKLILTPVEVVSVLACTNGLNAYCNTILGAMGLNTLDAVYVLFCQKGLFGQGAADVCLKKGSIPMQVHAANELGKVLIGGKVFATPNDD